MSIEEMHAAVREFCETREWDEYHAPKELAIGMATESSELLQEFRFKDHDEQLALLAEPDARADIEDELADVLFFVLRFADMYDVELDDALASKIEKNRARFPANEYKGRNEKYDE
jgi:NTP pyrophosphatase (non-canonical NTP hydrolase)